MASISAVSLEMRVALRLRILRRTNPRRRYDNVNQSSRDVIDKAGNKPIPRQCRNRPQQSNIDGNGCAGIGDRFSLEFRFRYLKIARQHGGIADEASHAAISVLEYDEVKLAAASRNLPQPHRFARVDPTAPTTLG
jgi:hypothetical protein